MMWRTLLAVLLIFTFLGVKPTWAKPVNPFARPVTPQSVPVEIQTSSPASHPELRGLIWAGEASVANLNGTPLAIGESFAGYQLESVAEDSATFLRGDESITLFLDEREDER